MRAAAALAALALASCGSLEVKKFARTTAYAPDRGPVLLTTEGGARFRSGPLYLEVGGGTEYLTSGELDPLTSWGLWWYSNGLRVGYRGELVAGSDARDSHFIMFETEW